MGLPGDVVVKILPASAGDTEFADSIAGSGRSPGVGDGNRLQYSCLENPIDSGVWQSIASCSTLWRSLKVGEKECMSIKGKGPCLFSGIF